VWVWRERDLSGEFTVDQRGRVVLPLLGEFLVAGKSADTLAAELRSAYRRFLTNPSIQVTVLRRVAVLGHVARPGLYPVDPTLTVATVIALAGGVSPSGDAGKIRLVRGGRVMAGPLGPNAVLEQAAVQSGDEIHVPERPWLSRNRAALFWTALVTVTTAVTVTLITR
jgi:polysaccharide export outer membrane protein